MKPSAVLAVQVQVLPPLTAILPVPPLAAKLSLVAASVKGQLVACAMVKLLSATVIVPVRAAVPKLGATEYATPPLPVPLNPAVSVIQSALLFAVQVQSVCA